MYYDNKVAAFIANNSAFHEKTKHIEVDCHFIRDAIASGKITTPYIVTEDQIADAFTKALSKKRLELSTKLSMLDVYAPA
jgi:ATP sulfurylase